MTDVERLTHEDVGYLEYRDFARARWAYDYSMKFMPWLREAGYVNFAEENERIQSSSESPLGIPATKLAYLELTGIIGELNRWEELEDAANDKIGASLLIDLGREMSSAVHRWPMEERPHRIIDMRCGGCGMLTLMYRPPRWEGDDVKADCSSMCGFELVGQELADSVAEIEKEEIERQLGERRRGRKKSS